jgi:uncharacterized repeat protein (TIGR01451 family)
MNQHLILATMVSALALTQCGGTSGKEATATGSQALQGSLQITTALSLSAYDVDAGTTVTGTVTYTNTGSHSVKIDDIAVAARPPGGTHTGGPFDDFGPYSGPMTLAAGQAVTVTATRTFTASDPGGAWDVYSTYESASGVWSDGPDQTLLYGGAATQDGALAITSALAFSETAVSPGDTVTGTVTLTNDGTAAVDVEDVVIAARPPGGTHTGGPFDDFAPTSPSQTLAPGASIALTATRTFSSSDPSGSWDVYPTWQDGSGTWHDGPDSSLDVSGGGSGSSSGSGGGGSSGGSGSGGSSGSSSGGGSGAFTVANGQILGPDGQPFVALGIDISTSNTGPQVAAMFPGINFVRLPTGQPYPSASDLQSLITSFTDAGIVVEIEDHPWPEVAPYTGSALTAETDWYASLASAFAGNPYVWFGTMNEPQTAYGSAEAAISTQEVAIYDAIRGAGSNTILMMELMGGGNPGTIGAGFGMTASSYASMTNIVWDLHFYAWVAGYSSDQGTVTAALFGSASAGQGIAAAQTIPSADGTVPVLIGEYGNSTDGQNIDADWVQVITAVTSSGYGSAAWAWDPGAADVLVSGGALTPYGQMVAQYIATGP